MPLTDNQKTAVQCSGRPLFIQAGAGTGKTFTLTKKIAYGLSQESGPLIPGVDSVLTITFTNKAAGELLGRVRAELRAQGMKEEALRIDGAWISTIHKMCQRVLSSHALVAHIDPGLALLSETATANLRDQAVEDVLASEEAEAAFKELSRAFKVDGAYDLLFSLTSLVSLAPEGVEGFCSGPRPQLTPLRHARNLADTLRGIVTCLDQLGIRDEGAETTVSQMDNLDAIVAGCEELAAKGDELTWDDMCTMLGKYRLPKGGRLKKVYKETFAQATESFCETFMEASCGRAWSLLQTALKLANKVAERHAYLKAGRGVMDTDDLLIGTYRLLSSNPKVAAEYRSRFASIMVDEFQDTDPLQVSIVESMCDDLLSTLVTVGDAQQSIYGFRGADLETYKQVRTQMAQCDSCEVKLDTNYRSHPHILAFVESIFSSQNFFGRDFLFIGAGEANARSHPWIEQGEPRVEMKLAAGARGETGSSHTSADDLRAAEARMIAKRFKKLADGGAAYGDMAILMFSTKKSVAYASALRELGIPCAVNGGTDFYSRPEVKVLVNLLRVLELQDDERPLLELLASPMFDLSDDDLLSLRVVSRNQLALAQGDVRSKVTLYDALRHQATVIPCGEDDPLVRAYAVLRNAQDSLGLEPMSSVVERAVVDSGWAAALAAEGEDGLAQRANILRFEDTLDELEAEYGPSPLQLAEALRSMVDRAEAGRGAKGKSGRMVGLGGDAVQIMTIHASKGLEFPIVAVAQYSKNGSSRSNGIVSLTDRGARVIALPAAVEGSSSSDVRKGIRSAGDEIDSYKSARDVVSFNAYAQSLSAQRAAQEEQRLLYVALTRARDLLLLVSSDPKYASTGELSAGLFRDVAGALFPDGLPSDGSRVMLDTGCLVQFNVETVPCCAQGETSEDEAAEPDPQRTHLLPAMLQGIPVRHFAEKHQRICSYSSIAQGEEPVVSVYPALRNRDEEQETVSPVGSAFHLVAQWVAMRQELPLVTDPALMDRIMSAAHRYDLDDEGYQRLFTAVVTWLGSPKLERLFGYERRHPEYPFCIRARDRVVEGFIDLLCIDRAGEKAYLIDYKTGGSGTEEQLRDRYALQARCYAYAVLSSGLCNEVELAFVRPEVNLQEITFNFKAQQVEELEELIFS